MKGNGRIIGFLAVIVIITVFVLLTMTVFTVQEVQVLNKVESQLIDKDAIIEDSGIEMGSVIFLLSENKVTAAIEKSNPYINVTSIERAFPNKVIIHVTMRTPLMAVKIQDSTLFALVDKSLKILEIVDSDSILYASTTKVYGIEISDPKVSGELYKNNDLNLRLSGICEVAEKEQLDDVAFLNFFESISFTGYDGSIVEIKLRSGVTILLKGFADTQVKLRASLEKYRSLDEQNTKRLSGYIYHDETNGWDWCEEYPYSNAE